MQLRRLFFSIGLLFIICVQITTGIISFNLSENELDGVGVIQVNGSPGIQMMVDNISKGLIPASGTLIIPNVSTGTRHLTAMKGEGIPPENYVLNVFLNETAFLEIDSQTLYGNMEITSNPPNVLVYLDSNYVGITPYTSPYLVAGDHNVILQMKNFQEWSEDVIITPGEISLVSADLIPMKPTNQPVESSIPGFTSIMALFALVSVIICIECKKQK